MAYMKRVYDNLIKEHFKANSQMAFLTGPRQVGKTTTCRSLKKNLYISWDNDEDRSLILQGQKALVNKIGLSEVSTIIFDEIHKYANWKNYIKGLYDSYGKNNFQIIVTGSARFDVYRKGADSLMGRYFLYRMHPLSVAEILYQTYSKTEIRPPKKIADNDFNLLVRRGGFPEPFLRKNSRFYNKWKILRRQLLFREDIRDVTKIHEIAQVEVLAELLKFQSSQLCNFASLARKVRASENSIRSWTASLESLYYCFLLKPWSKNISRSLIKEPKVFLWDWSVVQDKGARYENFIASHLLKAVHWWQDNGFGEYSLHYVRTKDKREVDFVVIKNNEPWFLVEVKSSRGKLSGNLKYFQKEINAKHAFQVTIDEAYVNKSCFDISYPVIVPAKTFLSQLI